MHPLTSMKQGTGRLLDNLKHTQVRPITLISLAGRLGLIAAIVWSSRRRQ